MTSSFDLQALRGSPSLAERLLARAFVVWMLRAAVVVAASASGAAFAQPGPRVLSMALVAVRGLLGVQAGVRWARGCRARRLASIGLANDFGYRPAASWSLPSSLMHGARRPRVVDLFQRSGPDGGLSLGTLEYGTERAGVEVAERWAFVAWRSAAVRVPHILVHSVREAGRSLPARLDESQRLDLEGDFPSFFRVYCEPGAERDALYLLTPDLMAALVDQAGLNSVEFIDDTILCFAPGAARLDSADGWVAVERLLNAVGPRVLDRASRLRGVAPREADSGGPATPSLLPTPTLLPPSAPAPTPTAAPAPEWSRPRLRSSTSLRNRSTFVVESICAVVVAGAVIWAWMHR